jgi:O-antigen ligase
MIAMSERSLDPVDVKGDVGARLARVADGLAAAVAISLPWSTSATGILAGLWLIALLPTLDPAAIRREVASAAGGLPVLLWAFAALGMLWADVGWGERVAGLSGFHKLLVIPLLLAQFRRSENAIWVILGLLASAVVLLLVSWAMVLFPDLLPGKVTPGVPVKDYLFQSSLFAICALGLIGWSAELGRDRAHVAVLLVLVAMLFFANIIYVAASRTTLVVLPILLLLFGFRRFGWKGALGACLIGGVLAGAGWESSPYLRGRLQQAVKEVDIYISQDRITSAGLRLEYWKRSFDFIVEAPVLGHGTGTIPALFRRGTGVETDPQLITSNPHNQVLTVGIEIGALGVALLIAMWIAHLALFRGPSLTAWLGLVIVVESVAGSMFNSFLSEFTHGWLYVLGVGVLGGAVRREAQTGEARGRT